MRKTRKRRYTPEQMHRKRVRAGRKAARTRKANLRAKARAEQAAKIRQGMESGPFTDDPSYNRLGQYRSSNGKLFYSTGIQHTLNMIYNFGYTQVKELVDRFIDENGYEAFAAFFNDNYYRGKTDKVDYESLKDIYSQDVQTAEANRETLAQHIRKFMQVLADAVGMKLKRRKTK